MDDSVRFFSPAWTVDGVVKERTEKRKTLWESDFDKNYQTFAQCIADGIAKEVFEKIEATFKDPYVQLPNKNNTLSNNFSFEIVRPDVMKQISKLAGESAKLAPFNEWVQRFSIQNQKLGEDDYRLISSFGKFAEEKKGEEKKGIDREYFQDMMAIVGRLVQTKLSQLFGQFSLQSGNSNLKLNVVWYRKADQLIGDSSNFKDNSICVTVWLEDKKTVLNEVSQSLVRNTIEKQRETRRRTQNINRITFAVVVVALAVIAVYTLLLKSTEGHRARFGQS
jgi:hypothetical protein